MKLKSLIKGLLIIFAYLLIPTIFAIFFGNSLKNLNIIAKSIFLLIFQLVATIFVIAIYYKGLKNDFKEYQKSFKTIFKDNFKYYLFGLITMYMINIVITNIFGSDMAVNEQLNRESLNLMPIYSLPSMILLAPISEEIIFRYSFKDVFKNKLVFVLFTGIIFGLAHLAGDYSLYNLLFTLSYSSLGCSLSYIYAKTNNIFSSISFHILHNTLAILLIIFL